MTSQATTNAIATSSRKSPIGAWLKRSPIHGPCLVTEFSRRSLAAMRRSPYPLNREASCIFSASATGGVIVVPSIWHALNLRYHLGHVPLARMEHDREMKQQNRMDMQRPESGEVPLGQRLALLCGQIEAIEDAIVAATKRHRVVSVGVDAMDGAIQL